MDRLARYAADKAVMGRLLELRAFERFQDAIARIIAAQVRPVREWGRVGFLRLLPNLLCDDPDGEGNIRAAAGQAPLTPTGISCCSPACPLRTAWRCTWRS
jgi:hypothetical protein